MHGQNAAIRLDRKTKTIKWWGFYIYRVRLAVLEDGHSERLSVDDGGIRSGGRVG